MDAHEEHILTIAEIVRDSAAMNEAALAGDFDEVRFRNALIVGKAGAAELHDVVLAAAHLRLSRTVSHCEKSGRGMRSYFLRCH